MDSRVKATIRELLVKEIERHRSRGQRLCDIADRAGLPPRTLRRLMHADWWSLEVAERLAAGLGVVIVVDLVAIRRG